MTRPVVFSAVLAAVLLTAAAARVPAQQPASAQTELLTEVRLLRQAIETLAGTNARVQIVFGRLQLQEQRVESAAKRLDAARGALKDVDNRILQISSINKNIESSVANSRLSAEQVEELQGELQGGRRAVERAEAERAQLLAAEADAAGVLNQEQGRWSDLNRQLDELERALAKQ
jgi:hypothetical protein